MRYRAKMNKIPDEWRKKRMQDLADKFGGNTPLGHKLKYKDGAYVRQMIAGERPISEKTIIKAEALPGCAGWFDQPKVQRASPPPPPPAGFQDSRTLTAEQWEMYNAFSIMTTAEEKRGILEKYQALKAVSLEEMKKLQGQKGKEKP